MAEFIAAEKFEGPKPGYTFTNGAYGVGYYIESDGSRAIDAQSADSGSAERAAFVAAEKFEGPKPGYAFTNGAHGLGYYLEGKSSGPPKVFIAAKKFEGPKPGYNFTQGPQGLGYYPDEKADITYQPENDDSEDFIGGVAIGMAAAIGGAEVLRAVADPGNQMAAANSGCCTIS